MNIFISWVKLLYFAPRASVRTNNIRSEYYNLYRSTRQGCPLNPLLFAIAIEPLSAALKSDPLIKGVTRLGIEQKVSSYADDILLYISDLSVSVPAVLNGFKLFGFISGHKLNLSKNEFCPLSVRCSDARQILWRLCPSWPEDGFYCIGSRLLHLLTPCGLITFFPFIKLERIRYSLRGSSNTFYKMWGSLF